MFLPRYKILAQISEDTLHLCTIFMAASAKVEKEETENKRKLHSQKNRGDSPGLLKHFART